VNDLEEQLSETLARRADTIRPTPDLADAEHRAERITTSRLPRTTRRAVSAAAIVVLIAGASVAVALNRPDDTSGDGSLSEPTSPDPTAPPPDTAEAEVAVLQDLDSPWCAGRAGPIERIDVLRTPASPTDGFESLSAAASSFFTAQFVDAPAVPA
jgi:hypothetical protein